jgi:hypothetical protein
MIGSIRHAALGSKSIMSYKQVSREAGSYRLLKNTPARRRSSKICRKKCVKKRRPSQAFVVKSNQ